jgi:outer membrane protein OmpA-like peptidoglycan-associated protein
MSKLLVILLGLLAFGILAYFCINHHKGEFMTASAPAAVTANANVSPNLNANTNANIPANVSTNPLTAATPKAELQVRVEQEIAGKTIEFATGSDRLTDAGKKVLDGLVPIMEKQPDANFEVAGHTDDQGDDAKNLSLSERRAITVKNYLAGKGLKAERFTPKGYGEKNPVADNNTAEGRQKNRRIEFTLKGDK